MKEKQVIASLSALAQESRLAVYRQLVKRGPEGYAAGEIGARLGVPSPTLSFHLKALAQAGLVSARRDGRNLYYSANISRMHDLVAFLTDQCCSLATEGAPACCPPAMPIAKRKSA